MPVGFREGCLDDQSRPNWDGNGPRPLSWAAWYPASDDAVERAHFLGPVSDPWFSIGLLARDAPLPSTRRRYPLVVLSHGTGGNVLGLGWLGRRLAQHGFVVVGVSHHGNTINGPYRAEGFLCWWERARDLTVLLDQIATQSKFSGRLDMDQVFVAGYSLGGCIAIALLGAITTASRFQPSPANGDFARGVREFPDLADHLPGLLERSAVFRESWARMSNSYRDARFRAALVLAPGRSVLGFDEKSIGSIEAPIQIVVGGADAVVPAAIWLRERLRGSTLDMLAPDVGHYVFLPEATEAGRHAEPNICRDAPGVDRAAIHEQVARAAVELFRTI